MSAPSDPASSRRRWWRWIRRSLELVLIGAAAYLAVELLSEIGWSALESQIRSAAPSWVALAVTLLLSRWLVWTARWRLALSRIGARVSRRRALFSILAAAALNHLTPAFRVFGGLVRARYASHRSKAAEESPDPARPGFARVFGTVVFDQIINQTVMGLLSALAFVLLSWRLGRPNRVLAGSIVVVALAALVPLVWRHLRRRRLLPSTDGKADLADHVGRRLRPLVERSREVLAALNVLLRDWRLISEAFALGLVYAACNIGAAWAAFRALGETVPLAWTFYAVSLGVTIGALSGTPGGSLTTEAAMVTCYSLLGVDRGTALAATLLFRGLHYALVLFLGLPSLAGLEAQYRRARTAGGEALSERSRPCTGPPAGPEHAPPS